MSTRAQCAIARMPTVVSEQPVQPSSSASPSVTTSNGAMIALIDISNLLAEAAAAADEKRFTH
jgi:hypothetical protein